MSALFTLQKIFWYIGTTKIMKRFASHYLFPFKLHFDLPSDWSKDFPWRNDVQLRCIISFLWFASIMIVCLPSLCQVRLDPAFEELSSFEGNSLLDEIDGRFSDIDARSRPGRNQGARMSEPRLLRSNRRFCCMVEVFRTSPAAASTSSLVLGFHISKPIVLLLKYLNSYSMPGRRGQKVQLSHCLLDSAEFISNHNRFPSRSRHLAAMSKT